MLSKQNARAKVKRDSLDLRKELLFERIRFFGRIHCEFMVILVDREKEMTSIIVL